jgi:hypothetical protein
MQLEVRVKMVGKIPRNFGSVFPYFLVIFILFGKYDNRYETGYGVAGIGRNTVGLLYCPFLDWSGKSGNFLDLFRIAHTVHLGFPALFI